MHQKAAPVLYDSVIFAIENVNWQDTDYEGQEEKAHLGCVCECSWLQHGRHLKLWMYVASPSHDFCGLPIQDSIDLIYDVLSRLGTTTASTPRLYEIKFHLHAIAGGEEDHVLEALLEAKVRGRIDVSLNPSLSDCRMVRKRPF